MKRDPFFLQPHPRTRLWWQQREQCLACAHLRRRMGTTAWKCAAVGGPGRDEHDEATCITARDEGHACGPNADLFKPAG